MSSPHPTIAAWERDPHAGHYDAELNDWKMRVFWTPGPHDARGMFHWEATRDDAIKHSHEGFTEMEHAMADAEQVAALDAAKRSARLGTMING